MRATLTTVSDRLEIVEQPHAAADHSFGEDIAAGLQATPKRLASKYLYDDLGSALFDAITKLPEYYLTRAETQILREWGWEIVRALHSPVEFLELGSGSAVKTRLLIEEALRAQGTLRFSPIDISRDALTSSSIALVDAYPNLSMRAYVGDYFHVLASPDVQFNRRVLALFMGSNIGNYTPEAASKLLSLLARKLRPGDGLLLGTDLKKDRTTLELAYDDPTGVTASFNLNLLARINRDLGGNFNVRAFEHIAEYDEKRGAVDSFLSAREPQKVRIEALNLDVTLAANERIHTESSYKFTDHDIAALGRSTGFRLEKSWYDRPKRFGIHLLVREG
jgi:L-histidine N-alpha-methyltransferase